jgi:hypothetical protein
MIWLALAGMAASAASSQAGAAAASAASIESAQASAEIESMNRAFQRSQFEKELARQKPFYEAGKAALPLYQQAINNTLDVTKLPLYKMQKGMIEKSFDANTPEYIKENAMQQLGAQEGELAKTRLADVQQIGLGQAGAAGQSQVNLGTTLANSLMRGGNALAQGQLSAAMNQQNAWTKAANDISGLPAYMASINRGPSSAPQWQYSAGSPTSVAPYAYQNNVIGENAPVTLGGASNYVLR